MRIAVALTRAPPVFLPPLVLRVHSKPVSAPATAARDSGDSLPATGSPVELGEDNPRSEGLLPHCRVGLFIAGPQLSQTVPAELYTVVVRVMQRKEFEDAVVRNADQRVPRTENYSGRPGESIMIPVEDGEVEKAGGRAGGKRRVAFGPTVRTPSRHLGT